MHKNTDTTSKPRASSATAATAVGPSVIPHVEVMDRLGAVSWSLLRQRACVTLKEAAVVLSTKPSQIRKLCRDGKINPITSLGRKWRIATADIERLLAGRLRNNVGEEA